MGRRIGIGGGVLSARLVCAPTDPPRHSWLPSGAHTVCVCVLGVWVNPHRERQTIPQGQTSKPAQIFPHANGQSAPGKAALATFAGARGATHQARPRSPSRLW